MFRQIFTSAFVIACMSAQGAAINVQSSAVLNAQPIEKPAPVKPIVAKPVKPIVAKPVKVDEVLADKIGEAEAVKDAADNAKERNRLLKDPNFIKFLESLKKGEYRD